MPYELVDDDFNAWARRHALIIHGRESDHRAIYVSSQSGECYQIWVEWPVGGQVKVNAICIEGPRDEDPRQTWLVDVARIDDALEEAFRTVLGWMAPSERFFPASSPLTE